MHLVWNCFKEWNQLLLDAYQNGQRLPFESQSQNLYRKSDDNGQINVPHVGYCHNADFAMTTWQMLMLKEIKYLLL